MNTVINKQNDSLLIKKEYERENANDVCFNQNLVKDNLWHQLAEHSAAIAHEVRNPLQTVLAIIGNLENAHSIDEKYSQLIKEELQRANTLLNDFLELFHECKMELVSNNVNKIYKKVVTLMTGSVLLRGVNLEENYDESLPQVLCDEPKIKQIFINLLSNALDASPRGSTIFVSTCVKDDFVQLSVRDSGSGVSEDVKDFIFEPFFTSKPLGTGIGLFLSRQIAQEHGGQLFLRDNDDVGAEFVLSLPIA